MQIVDFIVDSHQEYDDYHCLVLFSKGCNFRCHHCYNLPVINKKAIGDANDIMMKHVHPMHEAVVFLGGEPTIWGDKLVLSTIFAKEKFGLMTKVFTNGFKPDVIKKLIINKSVDAFSVDLKCVDECEQLLGINVHRQTYLEIVGDSITAIIEAGLPIEIRTTNLSKPMTDKVLQLVQHCWPGVTHIIQEDFHDQVMRAMA